MSKVIKILFIGDIVGRLGRRAIVEILPKLKKDLEADLIIANGENLAHGKGITRSTINEILMAGVDLLTTGNHVSSKPTFKEIVEAKNFEVIRPANYPSSVPGHGYKILDVKGTRVAVINLMGRIFFRETLDDPFRKLDKILEELKFDNPEGEQVPYGAGLQLITIIDWHTEATSEKAALAWYADGKVSAVLGTHTHVMTADERILPQGTAFISDVGMTGARDSILGVEKEGPIEMMRTQLPGKFEYPEKGLAQINAVLLGIDQKTKRALKIERIMQEVNIID